MGVIEKSTLLVDVTVTLFAFCAPEAFVTVKLCPALEMPTPVWGKAKEVGGLTESDGGSNWVEADRPDVSPVAVTVYSPPTIAFSENW